MKPTWLDKIKTKEDYELLVSTGYAWEFHSDLPDSWEECLEFKKKYDYYESVKGSNYKASLKLEGFEIEEEGFERSGN